MTEYGFEVRSSKSKCCPLSSGRSGWLLSQCPSPMVSLSSASLQPSSRPRRLPLLETASKKQVQWIIMRAILELAFSCWDGYRFIEANSGWYLGMDNYFHLLYTRLLQLNIYCPEFCPFRPILNMRVPQATTWHNSFGATINLKLAPEMMQKINGIRNQVNGFEYSN